MGGRAWAVDGRVGGATCKYGRRLAALDAFFSMSLRSSSFVTSGLSLCALHWLKENIIRENSRTSLLHVYIIRENSSLLGNPFSLRNKCVK